MINTNLMNVIIKINYKNINYLDLNPGIFSVCLYCTVIKYII